MHLEKNARASIILLDTICWLVGVFYHVRFGQHTKRQHTKGKEPSALVACVQTAANLDHNGFILKLWPSLVLRRLSQSAHTRSPSFRCPIYARTNSSNREHSYKHINTLKHISPRTRNTRWACRSRCIETDSPPLGLVPRPRMA